MDKPDSQEICFIPSNDYGSFLKREYFNDESRPGPIRTRDGKVIGEHEGTYHYTRGQRRGLGVAHTERLYVVETNPEANEVIVVTKKDVLDRTCMVKRMNWFSKPAVSPFRAHVKIRSQHTKAPATVTMHEDASIEVLFDEPQDAITPGQGAAIYEGPRVLGGGWIESAR